LRTRVRHVILLAIFRSSGGEMRYIPDWETLRENLARVMTTNALSTSEAQLDICRALSDQKLGIRCLIEKIERPNGTQVVGFTQPRFPNEPEHKIRRQLLPPNLSPDDFDWETSRPKNPWRHRISDKYSGI
jgi:hypothetical protein